MLGFIFFKFVTKNSALFLMDCMYDYSILMHLTFYIAYDQTIAEKQFLSRAQREEMEALTRMDAINNSTVAGVPYCVYCNCHVVTDVKHLSLLKAFGRLADRNLCGNIIINLAPDVELPDPEDIPSCGPPAEVNTLVADGPPKFNKEESTPLKESNGTLKFLAGESHADVNLTNGDLPSIAAVSLQLCRGRIDVQIMKVSSNNNFDRFQATFQMRNKQISMLKLKQMQMLKLKQMKMLKLKQMQMLMLKQMQMLKLK